ncbi:TerD family protein [Streptomyces neyagawaensis]|uniref:TerD family protein n=2 Tax=Streptomyces neyagawaensis TaxID=42238 RepID=UPI00201CD77C|nr:TerD family protein [Streptomyces neyagawaensis]MCL6734624.1 TerD family protein [Streptomyces neyagawaensis]MDE1682213.1 TerD family protein [Streptomyces neyagawaensis]
MHEMVKGANVGLAALSEDVDAVSVSLGWTSSTGEGDADVSVMLLGADGKVRGDGDFYFYNNPVAADGSVQLLGKKPVEEGSEDQIVFDLTAIPDDVERIVVAASRYEGARFGELDDLRVVLADGSGEGLLRFAIDDAGSVSAVIFGELYRRAGEWKFRAVGQGYASGLAGLATDFGVDIEDDASDADADADAEADVDVEADVDPGVATVEDRGVVAGNGAGEAAVGTAGAGVVATAVEQATPSPLAGSVTPVGAVTPAGPPGLVTQADPAGPVTPADPARPEAPGALVPGQSLESGGVRAGAQAGTLPAVPAPRQPEEDAGGRKPSARPRTAKKKVTLPKAVKKSLAENESWREARLFPVSALKSDRDREARATSVLLSVMAQVPEFGRRLTAAFGAPAGRMETFTEVSLPHGETPRRPDGVIRVERAGKLWTALVETKTNGNALRTEQVQAYMDIAARRGYEAVITLSNDVALEGSPLVDVKIDRRRKHKVALRHLSWAEVAHQAQMLIRHEGVGNSAHAWLLQELLHYLQHENSGCHGFQNMGAAWVPVRNGIDDETLCQGDPRALEVVESWERLIRQVCLGLGGELGQKVLPVRRARRGTDPEVRRAEMADQLCREGRLEAELRIEGTPGILALSADLRTGKLRTSIEIPAPEQGYPLNWAKRLVRKLAEAPADLHVETLVDGGTGGPRGTLERLRPEPGDMLPANGAQITGFRLSLFKGMGSTRGNAESGFIRSVDDAVHRFYGTVVVHLDRPAARRAPTAERVAVG